MAFFSLEDRFGEIECIAFSRVFARFEHMIRTDAAVWVTGTLSLREDEPPKLLVNGMDLLVENERFSEALVQTESKKEAPSRRTESVAQPKAAPTSVASNPRRLFLRVPSDGDAKTAKARNLVALFDGDFPVFFYNAETAKYTTEPVGIFLSDYVLRELRALLGEENVILK